MTIEAADRLANNVRDSERNFELHYNCSCGIDYKIETINSYRDATIRFCEGYSPLNIYYRVDFKEVEFLSKI
ncbi:MAG: hypothetical protein ACFFC7_09140 [Candidatus Hermodarchaeota archaeon]